jgi:hypothetical protein
MTLRHAQRHIEASTKAHIRTRLTALGWLNADPTPRPFGAGLTVLTETMTGTFGDDPKHTIVAGTDTPVVNIVVAGQGEDVDQEVGGPLVETPYSLFVTVVALPSLAAALGEDVLDLLAGRTSRPVIPFIDQITSLPVTGETLELAEVSSGKLTPDRPDVVVIGATILRTFDRSWS